MRHPYENDSSEIVYILLNEQAKALASSVSVESYTDSSVSDHILVYIILKIRTAKKNLKPVTVKLKPKWDRCDKTAYEEFISRRLSPLDAPQTDLEFLMSLEHLTTTLKRAAYASIPNHKSRKEIKLGHKRIWSPEISKALKCCKDIWWQWRMGGHPLVIQKKQAKRNLRKAQRQAAARKSIVKIEKIMSSQGSDKEFYRLVKEQRKSKDSVLQFLCVNGKILESIADVCDG